MNEKNIKMKLYDFLVNRHSGIRESYHRIHDEADGAGKIRSYAALLKLNAEYYLMGKRDFGTSADVKFYEEKELKSLSESAAHIKRTGLDADRLIRELSAFDVISFDIFDTLLLRPFSDPTDKYFFLGEKLGIMDFKRIRVQQEYLARKDHEKKYGDNEVTFKEIWKRIERQAGVPAEKGMKAELEAEERFLYVNPFMLKVFEALKSQGKTLIAVSDMYLPEKYISGLLKKKGYKGISSFYMSCEYGKSKSLGDIYLQVKSDYKGRTIAHIGDNEHSDVKNAKEAGLAAYIYPNVNAAGKGAGCYDMSPVAGGAYRGVVNGRLYNGLKKYPPEYEYGYKYGGIFVLGYCAFIHDHCRKNGIDKILFLSRDGDILKKAYDFLYPGEDTEYAYISRSVVTKLMRNRNRYDFFLRFVDKMINQGYSIADVLDNMGLGDTDFRLKGLKTSDKLTDGNAGRLKECLIDDFSSVNEALAGFDEGAEAYYSSLLSGVKKAAVVDIGWAGSAAVSLSILAREEWGLKTDIVGLVAGTNTIHNSEPDAAEEFLQNGRLVPYVFSQSLNRDIMKKHDPAKNYNVYWELLLSSPTRQFTGFSRKEGDNGLLFGDHDANTKGIKRIQKGIMDFVRDYHLHFSDYPYMFGISGRDAAAPMLMAAGNDERYLKAIAGRFDLKKDVS